MVVTYCSLEAHKVKLNVKTVRQNTIVYLRLLVRALRLIKSMNGFRSVKLPEANVRMIQIDGPLCRVYIKFHTSDRTYATLQAAHGGVEFRHDNGEISVVRIELASIGIRSTQLANLPPEVPDRAISVALCPYGEVKEVNKELWSTEYRYPVYNAVRIAVINLKKNISLHIWY
jgi:hypothetical protein